jgi:hypothetical protein
MRVHRLVVRPAPPPIRTIPCSFSGLLHVIWSACGANRFSAASHFSCRAALDASLKNANGTAHMDDEAANTDKGAPTCVMEPSSVHGTLR